MDVNSLPADLPDFGPLPVMEQLPPDSRFTAVRHGNMAYTLKDYASAEQWLARAKQLRRQILMAAGLWPEPEKTPLRAQIYERSYHDGYTVEKVMFESLPGFYVTGNLYRPAGQAKQPRPAILNPHGHWKKGRLHHGDVGSVPMRCLMQARLGYVAFAYDMVGYQDSWQIVHRYANWVNSLWGISILGLQLWNSMRAVDFLASLPDVDPTKIGCTGASGGGTQTYLLTAVEPRIVVSAPVNMVSAHFQGGCVCENAPGLRFDTNNVELAALAAPRPMLLVSATGDWTCNCPKVEYPAIQSIYRLLGAEDRVACVQFDAEHNYNQQSRRAVYEWFLRWLPPAEPPADVSLTEPASIPPETDLQLFVNRPRPQDACSQSGVFSYLRQRSERLLTDYYPGSAPSLQRLRETYAPLWQHILPPVPAVQPKAASRQQTELTPPELGCAVRADFLWLGREAGLAIPAVWLQKAQCTQRPRGIALVVHPAGKAALLKPALRAICARLLQQDCAVLSIDLFPTGEHQPPTGNPGRPHHLAHFTTFNYTDAALRVQDIVHAVRWAATQTQGQVFLAGWSTAGPLCVFAGAALAASRDAVVTAPTNRLRIAADLSACDDTDQAYVQHWYIPGIRQAGDIRVAASLLAPTPLTLCDTSNLPAGWTAWMQAAYRAAGADAALQLVSSSVLTEYLERFSA